MTAPVVVQQRLPAVPPAVGFTPALANRKGVLEIAIDETGKVQSVVIGQSLHSVYDAAVLNQARQWRYQPSLKGCKPVKFRKLIQFVVG